MGFVFCRLPVPRDTGAVSKFRDFRPTSGYMWETIQDRAVVTMEGQ